MNRFNQFAFSRNNLLSNNKNMIHLYTIQRNALNTISRLFLAINLVWCAISFPMYGQQMIISSGAYINNSGAAYITISNANLVNNGTYTKGTETVTLSGNSAGTISGSGSTDLYALSITNTGGIRTLQNQLTAYNLTIASGSTFYIDTTKAVTVNGLLTNNAGLSGLVIKSNPLAANGTLIFHNAVGSPVQATVEMYSKASKPATNYKWQFFGIPVRSIVASPTFDGSFVREMHENNTPVHWEQLNNASTLTSFTGYEITQIAPVTVYFQGLLENGDFSSGKLSFTTGVTFPGGHLIGNPYTAAIDISKIVFGSTNPAIIVNTVYLYNCGSLGDWTSAGSGSSSGYAPGQYIAIPIKVSDRGIGLPAQIPSMQAFLVNVESDNALATVSIPYSSTGTVVRDTAQLRVRDIYNMTSSNNVGTRIDVKGSRFSDQMWIFTEPTCTHHFDNGWDGYKFFGSALTPQLFAMEADGNYQVNSVDDINNTDLGFMPGEDSIYTLTFTHENLETLYPSLYLLDLNDNTINDITQSGTNHTFIARPTAIPMKRFRILTSPQVTGLQNTGSQLIVFSSRRTLFIVNKSNSKGNLVLCDMSGRTIQLVPFGANCQTTIQTDLPPGAFIAKATTETAVVTKSLVFP